MHVNSAIRETGGATRSVVAGLFISLDGVVEAPNKWHSPYVNHEMHEAIRAGTAQSDAILMGRRTYESFAAFWPNQPSDAPMADYFNNTPKYVVSSTLNAVEWANSNLIRGDLAGAVAKLKQQPGKNIQIPGSPTLVRSLLRDGLLDELALMVHPLAVGAGVRLFDGLTNPIRLKLVESTTFKTGVLSMTYQPASA